METASLVEPTKSFPMVNASAKLDMRSTAAVFALFHVLLDISPSKVDVPSALLTPSSSHK